ncbi:hypothetical protein SAMN02983003_3070 [Devosia enhydra]|uniref:DUF6456 domain-containing protein n=1 Tax=Devosia enhydra TaxID=665118 RepID=A0A1K2I0I9_9HYPH|nr:DUF6456 domain-containing protein [Devosia enhydra]SFZ85898.1 hypothetical protein SAMN02983003_3070 [Devosia enhydra]
MAERKASSVRDDRPTRIRFVRMMVAGATTHEDGGAVTAALAARRVHLPVSAVRDLAGQGVLMREAGAWRAGEGARSWLRRALSESDTPHADQHRTIAMAAGVATNLAESPLARLATGAEAFLMPHQVEAGERLRRLVERAHLQPRLTMRYSATHTASGGGNGAADISDMAAEARRQLGRLHGALPADCAGVVMDVCGFSKGLQQVETERGWPRRSAKLVLRIGLEQLAQQFGLSPRAQGRERVASRGWMAEGGRPGIWE